MPNLPLGQEVYLIGVIFAFTAFVVVLAYGRVVTRDSRRQATPARQTQAQGARRHAAE